MDTEQEHDSLVKRLIELHPQGVCWRALSRDSGVSYGAIAAIARRLVKSPRCVTVKKLKSSLAKIKVKQRNKHGK